jgi:hypothetical protein
VTWRRRVHLSGEQRKALLARSLRTRQSLETLTREALQQYLAAQGAASLEALARQTGLPPALLWEQALQQYLGLCSGPSPSNDPSSEGDI